MNLNNINKVTVVRPAFGLVGAAGFEPTTPCTPTNMPPVYRGFSRLKSPLNTWNFESLISNEPSCLSPFCCVFLGGGAEFNVIYI